MLILANLIVTSLMTGIIWMVQLVVYPAFKHINQEVHSTYHQQHVFRIGPLVAPLMVIEFVLAALWLWLSSGIIEILHLSCAIIVWLSTFIIQVPLHKKLSAHFDLIQTASLIKTNWIRTIMWTIKLTIIGYAAFQAYQ